MIQEIPQKIHAGPNKYSFWLDIALLLLLIVYILSGISIVPFHGDESTYIVMSEDYSKIMKQHDFKRVLFNPDGNSKQYLRLSTGGILTMSIGFAREITNNNDPIKKWLWGTTWAENITQGNMPRARLLQLARGCSALMGALSVVFLLLSAYQLSPSRLVAWCTVLLFATHGDILVNIRRAMQEGPKFLFLLLTLYIAFLVLKDFQFLGKRRHLYVFLGIASGLTLAAKQDTAPMLVAIYIALALIPIWKKETVQTIIVNFLYLGAATSLAYAFFLAFMPVFWGWWETTIALIGFAIILFQLPLLKTKRILWILVFTGWVLIISMIIRSPNLWQQFSTPLTSMIQARQAILGGQITIVSDPITAQNRLHFLLSNIFRSKVMYMESSSFDVQPFHEQIAIYEDSFLSGRTGSPYWDGFIAIWAVLGGWSLIRKFRAESFLIYSLLVICSVMLFAMIPLLWQRYFLIMQIPYSLIAGVGMGEAWAWGTRLAKQTISRQS